MIKTRRLVLTGTHTTPAVELINSSRILNSTGKYIISVADVILVHPHKRPSNQRLVHR